MSDALRGLRASAVPRTRAVEDAPGTCATLRVGIGREDRLKTLVQRDGDRLEESEDGLCW